MLKQAFHLIDRAGVMLQVSLAFLATLSYTALLPEAWGIFVLAVAGIFITV